MPITFKTKPMLHQKDSIVWAMKKNRIALWHDVGLGKSLTSLYTHQIWETNRLLVVCPNSVIETWLDQVGLHTDWEAVALRGAAEDRKRLLHKSKAKVFVLNYEGLQVLFGRRIKQKKKRRTTWLMDRHTIREADFDGIIFDECQALIHFESIRTRVCRELSNKARYVIIQTATPISTSEMNLWPEYDVLDGGYTLSASMKKFLQKYFDQDRWGAWTIKKGALEDILDRIAPVTSRYSSEECLDLPEKIYEQRHCDMTTVQKLETKRIIESAGIDPMQEGNKLAQIAGGMLIEDKKPRRLKGRNPKLDELEILLKELPGKVIVFHSFIEEGRMIEERLHNAKIWYTSVRGEIKNKDFHIRKFRQTEWCNVLVAHPKSGGVGINLQEASTVIFYSNGTGGAIVREQAEGRIWRMGQEHSCLYIDLILRDSIDEERLERLRDREEMARRVLDYMESYR